MKPLQKWFLAIFLFATFPIFSQSSVEDQDFESRLRRFLGSGERLYNLYIRPYNKVTKILSRKLLGNEYVYFGLGVEYDPPVSKLQVFRYFFDGTFRIDGSLSNDFDIPPTTPIVLIPTCQVLILTQVTERGRELLILDSNLQQEPVADPKSEHALYLSDFYAKIKEGSNLRFENRLVKIESEGRDYSIPIQRLLDPGKYEFSKSGNCRKLNP